MNLELLCKAVGKVLFKRGIIGYITIDLISFPDNSGQSNHPLFWAIGKMIILFIKINFY